MRRRRVCFRRNRNRLGPGPRGAASTADTGHGDRHSPAPSHAPTPFGRAPRFGRAIERDPKPTRIPTVHICDQVGFVLPSRWSVPPGGGSTLWGESDASVGRPSSPSPSANPVGIREEPTRWLCAASARGCRRQTEEEALCLRRGLAGDHRRSDLGARSESNRFAVLQRPDGGVHNGHGASSAAGLSARPRHRGAATRPRSRFDRLGRSDDRGRNGAERTRGRRDHGPVPGVAACQAVATSGDRADRGRHRCGQVHGRHQARHGLDLPRVTSTDSVRQIMRSFLPPETTPRFTGRRSRAAKDAGFLSQAQALSSGVIGLIERAVAERTDLIIEGVHLIPGLLDDPRFRDLRSRSVIVQVLMVLECPEIHRSHFLNRLDNEHGRAASLPRPVRPDPHRPERSDRGRSSVRRPAGGHDKGRPCHPIADRPRGRRGHGGRSG